MIDKWLTLIEGEKLSRSESQVVKKFSQDPNGKYFLQFSDVLKAHGKSNESLELLIEGVGKHPSFSVARVLLSKNLLERGLIDEAWQNLQESPVSLDGNKLAQKLKIKLSILLGYEEITRNLLFEQKPSTDSEVISIKQDIVNLGFDTARVKLIESLDLDKEFILKTFSPKTQSKSQTSSSDGSSSDPSTIKEDDINFFPATEQEANHDPSTLNNFRLSNLSNAFTDNSDESLNQNFASSSLSSMTLASIYSKQGHYGKALSIYRQLLIEKPHNKILIEKIEELSRLDQKQTITDIGIDPEIADELERAKIIDYKISILNTLMSKLES